MRTLDRRPAAPHRVRSLVGLSPRRAVAAALAAVLSASLLTASTASADEGLVVQRSALPAAARALLEKEALAHRKAHPEAFRAVSDVAGSVARLDAEKRGRLAPIGPRLKTIGPEALLPMLELLALDAPATTLVPSAGRALRIGLLEAVGALHDPRAEAVLVAATKADHRDSHVAAAAARALGRLGSAEGLSTLGALAKGTQTQRVVACAGLGEHRRVTAVAPLRTLAGDRDLVVRVAAIAALGDVGNAQAWKTASMVRTEEAATRKQAATALVPHLVDGDETARAAAARSLLVIDEPSTPALLDAAKLSADEHGKRAIDAFARRFAANPTRLATEGTP